MVFKIDITNPDGDSGTINPDLSFSYCLSLNEINEGDIKFSGTGKVRRGLLRVGSDVKVYRDGNLELLGVIDMIDYLDGGAVAAHLTGYEFWLGKEHGTYSNSPYDDTSYADDIFKDILDESGKWNRGSVAASFQTAFRINEAQSLWNALGSLIGITQQDIERVYSTKTINIVNHLGSSTPVITFNDGINSKNYRVNVGYPQANKVVVLGKGDGSSQIRGEAYDAVSIAEYGEIKRTITDKTIVSDTEANKLAEAELAIYKQPSKVIDFDLTNPSENIALGDHIIINSADKDIEGEEFRVVAIERGIREKGEYCSLQVNNPDFKKKLKSRNQIIASLNKKKEDSDGYMQGNTNTLTFEGFINANNTAPLRVSIYIPEDLVSDEIGKLRIYDFKLNYEVEEFRSSISTSSAQDNFTGASLSNSSENANHGISNEEAGSPGTGYSSIGSTTSLTGDNTWRSVNTSRSNSSNYNYFFHAVSGAISINMDAGEGQSWAQGIDIRVRNTSAGINYPETSGINLAWRFSMEGKQTINLPFTIIIPRNWSGDTYRLEYKISNETNWDGYEEIKYIYYGVHGHTHNNSLTGGIHTHNNSLTDPKHGHNLTIGEGASDSGSINATQISSIKLKYWNGSNWVQKYEITNTGKISEMNVDLSNSGVYPDVAGFWMVEIYTNSSYPDLVKASVNIKHRLEN